jgi:hypothetical protein
VLLFLKLQNGKFWSLAKKEATSCHLSQKGRFELLAKKVTEVHIVENEETMTSIEKC